MRERFIAIDYLKAFAIVLVVMGHSFPDVTTIAGISNPFLRLLHEIIYLFHMPLMFLISGYLASKVLRQKAEFNEHISYIKTRFNRLIIPYLCVGLLYLPAKIIFSAYANKPYDLSNLWQILFGENPNGGLWFLYVLFIIQCTFVFILKKDNLRTIFFNALIVALIVVCTKIGFYRIDDALYYAPFYVLGFLLKEYDGFFCCSKSNFYYISLALFIVFGYSTISLGFMQCKLIAALAGNVFTWEMFCHKSVIGGDKKLLNCLCNVLSEYSMDIYIFHGMVMVVIRTIFYRFLNLNYFLVCLLMFVAGILIPLMLSNFVIRKYSILRKYILGMKC